MGASTPNLGLYKPGGGSDGITPDERVDVAKINTNSDLIDAFAGPQIAFRNDQVNKRNQQYRGLAADRGSVTGMVRGDTFQELDAEKKAWWFDGSNWATLEQGISSVIVSPVTPTNGTVNADGTVSFTSKSSLTLDGLFSAKFTHYRLEVNLTSASADGDLYLRYRVGGADSAVGYYVIYLETTPSGGPTRQFDSNTADARTGRFSSQGAIIEIDLYNPMNGQTNRGLFRSADSAQYGRTGTIGFSNADVDGVTLKTFSAGITISGSLRVIGIR